MRSKRFAATLIWAAALSVSITLFAAQPQSISFEVASVKRSPMNQYIPASVDPRRFWIVDTLAGAILWANGIFDHSYKLPGGPPWIHRDYYQIEGRTQAPATKREMQTMLQTLLADRFKLKLHREAKEMSVYALVIGDSGPKLQTASDSCGEDGCIGVAPGEFFARYATMDTIAATLSNMLDRPVLDQTGLPGRYDFRMRYDPSSVKPFNSQSTQRFSPDPPSIFFAIQYLGLKLEPRSAAVEILVVDSATEPLPD
jgi:bla regulator protein blaR1